MSVQLLDGHGLRAVLIDDFHYTIVQIGQPPRHIELVALAFGAANDAGFANARPPVDDFENAVTGDLQAGVDAEDARWVGPRPSWRWRSDRLSLPIRLVEG